MLRAWRGVSAVLFLAMLFAACAQLPSEPKVKSFGEAASKVTDILKRSMEYNAELGRLIGEEKGARDYVLKINRAALGADTDTDTEISKLPAATGILLPPPNAATLNQKSLELRQKLTTAIGGYAKALAESTDRGTIQELEAASIALGSAVGTAISPLLGSAAIPVISPAAQLIGRGIGLMAGNAYAVEVRNVIRETHPVLKEAVRELSNSIGIVLRSNRDLYNRWVGTKLGSLGAIRRPGPDDTVSRNAVYIGYRAAVSEARILEQKAGALKGYERVLNGLVAAHASLIEIDGDSDWALERFLQATNDFAAVASALK